MFRDGEYLIREASGGTRSRENSVASSPIASGAGTVVGMLTSTKKFKAWDPTANDGTQVVAGICHRNGVGTNEKFRRCARDAEVKGACLVYPAGQLAAATAGLLALGIIVR